MEVNMNSFSIWDYLVFFACLLFSMGIGVYFAVQGRKKKTEGEYLMASKSMSVIPVSLSTTASFMSAIAILGNPAEMYDQGATLMLYALGIASGCLVAAVVFVPLLYPLQLTSSFEYLEKRFNSRVARLIGTCTQIISRIAYIGTASFAPATAFNIVTGFPVWATLVIMSASSTFYTSIGGIKAVIWTDVFQSVIMMAGVLAVIIKGSMEVGSFSKVWEINDEWGRLNVWNFDPDPTVRHTFWSMVVGGTVAWMSTFGLYQTSVQRYNSLPTLRKAQTATLLTVFGASFLSLSCFVSGIVLFAYYVTKDCDPIGKKLVDSSNQLVPFFVMETLAYPCVPGIFLSAIFAGALSTISSALNALAAITWEDFLKPVLKDRVKSEKHLYIIQGLVVLYGLLMLALSFVVKDLEGTVLQIGLSLTGAASGPLTGMFVLGAFFPWANAKGAIGGAIIAVAVTFWVAVGAFVTGITKDKFTYPNGTCSEYFKHESSNTTTTTPFTTSTQFKTHTTMMSSFYEEKTGLEKLYSISYLWYPVLAVITTVVFGLIISFITGANSIDDVPTEYQIPIASRILCCLPKSWKKVLNCNREFEDPEDICERLEEKDQVQNGNHGSKTSNDVRTTEFNNQAFVNPSDQDNVTPPLKQE